MHATMHPKGKTFYSCDLMDYGLTDDQSYDICKKLFEEDRLNLPPGIELGDDF